VLEALDGVALAGARQPGDDDEAQAIRVLPLRRTGRVGPGLVGGYRHARLGPGDPVPYPVGWTSSSDPSGRRWRTFTRRLRALVKTSRPSERPRICSS